MQNVWLQTHTNDIVKTKKLLEAYHMKGVDQQGQLNFRHLISLITSACNEITTLQNELNKKNDTIKKLQTNLTDFTFYDEIH